MVPLEIITHPCQRTIVEPSFLSMWQYYFKGTKKSTDFKDEAFISKIYILSQIGFENLHWD
jgi:hypothetical protein